MASWTLLRDSAADPDNFAPEPDAVSRFRIRILIEYDRKSKNVRIFFAIFIPFKVVLLSRDPYPGGWKVPDTLDLLRNTGKRIFDPKEYLSTRS